MNAEQIRKENERIVKETKTDNMNVGTLEELNMDKEYKGGTFSEDYLRWLKEVPENKEQEFAHEWKRVCGVISWNEYFEGELGKSLSTTEVCFRAKEVKKEMKEEIFNKWNK